jgi:hypothetical protein
LLKIAFYESIATLEQHEFCIASPIREIVDFEPESSACFDEATGV